MTPFIQKALTNRHTTGAAFAYVAIEIGQQLACTWWPHHADQIYETARQLSKGVVGYGLIMAGDAKPQSPPLTPPPAAPTNPT
jgi:hypothetical protein